MGQQAQHIAQVRIIGPTVRGTFFIANTDNHVWDGKCWRGFGTPAEWRHFQDAFRATRKTKSAIKAQA